MTPPLDNTMFGTEPTADQRTVARTLWGLYVALCEAGFDQHQALAVIIATVGATAGGVTD